MTELEAAADKTSDTAMDVSKGDMVELQAKVSKIMKDVQSYCDQEHLG